MNNSSLLIFLEKKIQQSDCLPSGIWRQDTNKPNTNKTSHWSVEERE